jgi:superfamily II DNA or RNA helicase
MNSAVYAFEKQVPLHDYQRASVARAEAMGQTHTMPRMCLYYKTGAGKTRTALAAVKVMGDYEELLIVAPPTTHQHWQDTARAIGFRGVLVIMSHAKFRQKETKMSRAQPVIVDEFHMLGGYKGQGFKKLERLAGALKAPLIICSATPNYNDVERCYCIQRITDRRATEGGYLAFVYKHCNTVVNPFGHVPKVEGFTHYPDAATFLADLPNVEYIEDDLVYDIEDVELELEIPAELVTLGIDRRRHKMVGSIIERKHTVIDHMLVTPGNFLADEVTDVLVEAIHDSPTPVLVFAVHKGVAQAAVNSLIKAKFIALAVHGQLSAVAKNQAIEDFKLGRMNALVGTQTLATGTDGLDKMCDTLVILDDTEDDSMRRQLIGRIMPRGEATTTAHSNRVVRIVATPSVAP